VRRKVREVSVKRKTLLIMSQVYVPDPAAVGQHLADAAAEMVRRGWRVVVLTARRGYDDPSVRYAPRETISGADVRRLPLSSFGKKSIFIRLVGGLSFILQAIVRGLFVRDLGCILVSTSPPMCPAAAALIGFVRRVPVKYWAMDINPDQLVVLGRAKPGSLPVRVFEMLNRLILRRAADVVTLDRFMAERLLKKRDVRDKLAVIPPWAHEEHLAEVNHADNPFRRKHDLGGKFVFMYSGNMSIASPLTTVLDAALALRDDPRIVFMFIGGGLGRKAVQEVIDKHRPPNVRLLPYQPLSELKNSLSAADVHLVTLGNEMVGIIHPCKIYGAMTIARPVLLVGPSPSHLSDLVEGEGIGWRVDHGDVAGAVRTIRAIAAMPPNELAAVGRKARRVVDERFGQERLCGSFCDVLERGAGE